MPNWCDNQIIIRGTKEEVDYIRSIGTDEKRINKVWNRHRGCEYEANPKRPDFRYEAFFNEQEIRAITDKDNWYENSIAVFGSKWIPDLEYGANGEPDKCYGENDLYELHLWGDSAWGPTIAGSGIILRVGMEKFPESETIEVLHSYFEMGMQFAGVGHFSTQYASHYYEEHFELEYLAQGEDDYHPIRDHLLESYSVKRTEDLLLRRLLNMKEIPKTDNKERNLELVFKRLRSLS